ncbi:MAG: DGQHR domain-containing protein [Serratia sp. (in: enterobacteria)]|uniref:DGQHR domain-containing protein n=1 Tax=Serratia sp. (in: enterobacteria) TaxID=616 RepID=UPI003F40C861
MNKAPTKSSMTHFFEFPASFGFQGDTQILLMSVPGRTLTRVLASDNFGHALERSQREINKARVKKFYNYLVESTEKGLPFIIPPLVGNCDSDIEFEPFGNTNVGVVRFPMDAEILLFDGQHRAAGIEEFCHSYSSLLAVPLMLTQKLPLKIRQQFFSDINNNVSKPAAAINMVYDGRDDVAQTMVSFLRKNDTFARITDFEHNVVPSKSSYWVSFKALCDATSKFIGEGDNKLATEDIESIWQSWVNLTAINDVRVGTNQSDYKKDYLQFHAVMINAFGFAVQRLLQDRTVSDITQLIDNLSINTDTGDREDFFLISNWGGICANVDKERPTVVASVAAQKAAAERLVEVITSQSLPQGEKA